MRTIPLYDAAATPSTWCERMSPGEFAVHTTNSSSCTIFPSLTEAETFAAAEAATTPTLRARIYDHQGFIGEPLREFAGTSYRGNSGLSPRYLRILGLSLLVSGTILFAIDWTAKFRFGWPGFIGARLLIFGLLVTAFALLSRLHQFQRSQAANRPGALKK